jgi:excinuclease ABC subunit A
LNPAGIQVRGAREHNLKGIDLDIPRERLVVVTGPSGSGKSSLARDTLYAEGHRRYVECLSAEARQYLRQIRKPAVDSIEGLPPAVYIDQRPWGRNPRSTVGTATEVLDLLRLLFSKAGTPHCLRCANPIRAQSLEQMADRLLELPEGTRALVLAPVRDLVDRGGLGRTLRELERQGFLRVRLDGRVLEIGDPRGFKGRNAGALEVVVDRLVVKPGVRSRLNDSIETAARLSQGLVTAWIDPESRDAQEWTFSEGPVCGACGLGFPEISPRLFSFNSPQGACPACGGLGKTRRVDAGRVVPDTGLSLSGGAIHPWRKRWNVHTRQVLESLALHLGFSVNTPVERLPEGVAEKILHGCGPEPVPFRFQGPSGEKVVLRPYEGVVPNLARRFRETGSDRVRQEIARYMTDQLCPACGGTRLRPEALAVRVQGTDIGTLTARSVLELGAWLQELELAHFEREVLEQVLDRVRRSLDFLARLGLDYLTLDRETGGLSGGEAQRIQLATHVGSGLVGVLYLLDEPTLGLHPHDTGRLLALLEELRDRGNTVLVVEHDEQVIRAADAVVDMGPGAGTEGGRVVFSGPPGDLERAAGSVTGQFLSGRRRIPVPAVRALRPDQAFLRIAGARVYNLKGVDARIPVGALTCVTGVSGSGKSSLVLDALHPALARRLAGTGAGGRPAGAPGSGRVELAGVEFFDRVIPVDQAPLSRSPRSNPATYTGVFSLLRDLFAELPESRRRGYGPARFSFNVKGGRCEVCAGEGLRKVEMHFLPDVFVTCDLCRGSRYNRETLEVRYRGMSIAQVLDMTVAEASAFFDPVPQVARKLGILDEVGLGYMRLGQPANTLSGGEAQRVKLARELARWATGRTLYILDEPTTGLHFVDIEKLLLVLRRLTGAGNTVVVIEHNLEVIKTADWVIDLGPGAGEQGGRLVVEGPPEAVCDHPESLTGRYLAPLLRKPRSPGP